MNIRFGGYGVRNDGEVGWIVYKVTVVTGENTRGRKAKAESIGQEREKILGYYQSFHYALRALMNRHLSAAEKEGSEYISLQIIMDRLAEVEALIFSLPKITPQASDEKEEKEEEDDEADVH